MKKRIIIPKISQKEFWRRLKKRKLEDVSLIKRIESYFIGKRGYVFRMPRPGTPVILLYSGGLDSNILCGLLMEKYKLHVYPLFVNHKSSDVNHKIVVFFSDFFEKRHPQLFHMPEVFSFESIYNNLNRMSDPKNIHPTQLFNLFEGEANNINIKPLAGLNSTYAMFALFYREELLLTQNIKINTIFCGVEASDGIGITSQTFTFIRTSMLYLCLFNRNFDLQFVSPFIEKELGFYLEKYQSVKIGSQLDLPMEKTYSCYTNRKIHCGRCLSCGTRRNAFKKAKIIDKTIYQDKLWTTKQKARLKYYLTTKNWPHILEKIHKNFRKGVSVNEKEIY